MSDILYVTSFNAKMYEISGRRLIDSFLGTGSEGEFFFSYEGFSVTSELQKGFFAYCLQNDNDRDKFDTDVSSREKTGYWNKNVHRWFRKILTIYRASFSDLSLNKILVWVDCDCVFLKKITQRFIEGLFQDASIFFLKAKREFPETGLVGFKNDKPSRRFIHELFSRYVEMRFLNDLRWDDCYQFSMVANSMPDVKMIDLATRGSGSANVINHSPFAGYIRHYKGSHKRAGLHK